MAECIRKEPELYNINLINGYSRKIKNQKILYKSMYSKLPIKLSSTTFLEVFVLFTLSRKSEGTYGLDILNDISKLFPEEIWKPSHGNLYPLLTKMVDEGLIDKKYVDSSSGTNNKKFYVITDLGLYALNEKLDLIKPMIKKSENFFKTTYNTFFEE